MAERRGPIAMSRRDATALLLVAGATAALPAMARAPRRPADESALRAAAEFAMSF